jgi:hypothetical protein
MDGNTGAALESFCMSSSEGDRQDYVRRFDTCPTLGHLTRTPDQTVITEHVKGNLTQHDASPHPAEEWWSR